MNVETFWKSIDVRDPDECWLWKRAITTAGYGSLVLDGVREYAHRLAYKLVKGPIPPGLYVLHECDTPACCNPAHLKVGSQKQNMRDKLSRGRAAMPAGERNGRSKFTTAQVLEIRKLACSGLGQRELGRRYNVSHKAIAYILHEGWKHAAQP